jgi:DNA-binding transcriptional LysR family regulator
VPFGMHYLLPLVPRFVAAHPEVQLDIVLTDQVVDLLEQRADVAIRVGPLRSSQLVARKLGESKMVVVASPRYLKRRGIPKALADLPQHNLISFNFERIRDGWPFREAGKVASFPASGNVQVGDGESARQLALEGVGLTRLAMFHVGPDIKARRLQAVLQHLNPGDTEAIHAVFIGQGGHLPARTRAFIDYLAEHVQIR